MKVELYKAAIVTVLASGLAGVIGYHLGKVVSFTDSLLND